MSNPSNTSGINASNTASTQSYFNNLNLPPISVSQNVDDAIIGYFQQITETKETARALAGAVILTAASQGVDPMETLTEFTKMEPGQLNSYTTMFLNLNRVGTSYLGINNSPTAPKYVAHMIRP